MSKQKMSDRSDAALLNMVSLLETPTFNDTVGQLLMGLTPDLSRS